MKYPQLIAFILVIVGGINWLLVGLFGFNIVHLIFGKLGFIENIVYIIVGLAALYCLKMLKSFCPSSSDE